MALRSYSTTTLDGPIFRLQARPYCCAHSRNSLYRPDLGIWCAFPISGRVGGPGVCECPLFFTRRTSHKQTRPSKRSTSGIFTREVEMRAIATDLQTQMHALTGPILRSLTVNTSKEADEVPCHRPFALETMCSNFRPLPYGTSWIKAILSRADFVELYLGFGVRATRNSA